MENQLIPFGKYKGQPLEILAQDAQYLEWVRNQSWFVEKYPQINTLIINNFQEPSETPEHNKIQGMFLDEDFCLKLVDAHNKYLINLNIIPDILLDGRKVDELRFEVNGIDVYFSLSGMGWRNFAIEIKPSVGDDYPAILRQIKSIKLPSACSRFILLVDQYSGKGITEEQFVKLFKLERIMVLFLRDIV